jgi:hypothetical protein
MNVKMNVICFVVVKFTAFDSMNVKMNVICFAAVKFITFDSMNVKMNVKFLLRLNLLHLIV